MKSVVQYLKNKISLKEKDPGSFTIHVPMGGKELGRALCGVGELDKLRSPFN